jgi:hypothetical protein
LQFSSDLAAFPSPAPHISRISSKFAQFGNPLLPVGERDWLAWVMHCLPPAGRGITILACENFDSPNV